MKVCSEDVLPNRELMLKMNGDFISVTIYSDTDRFKGFLIEARTDEDEEEVIGVWSTEVPHTKSIGCFDSVVVS